VITIIRQAILKVGALGSSPDRLLSLYAYYLGRRLMLTIIVYEIKYSEQMEQIEQL